VTLVFSVAYLTQFINQRETDLELAVLCGHGKNGALSILQRTVKPQVVTTFELPGCTNMWTVQSVRHDKTVRFDEICYSCLARSTVRFPSVAKFVVFSL